MGRWLLLEYSSSLTDRAWLEVGAVQDGLEPVTDVVINRLCAGKDVQLILEHRLQHPLCLFGRGREVGYLKPRLILGVVIVVELGGTVALRFVQTGVHKQRAEHANS